MILIRSARSVYPTLRAASSSVKSLEEYNICRCADGRVKPRKGQCTGLAINAEGGDSVTALVATVKEISGGIEVEAAGVIAAGPLFPSPGEHTRGANGKPRDGVVQPIRGVKESSVC